MLFSVVLSLCSVLCGTWNLKWFPSGRAEHRASERVERANVEDAAELVRNGLKEHERTGEGVVLFFQELRDRDALSNLVAQVGVKGLATASVSSFRERDNRLGWQQCGVVSTLPVIDAGFSYWKRPKKVFPPRGYAYALLDGGEDGVIACFCVHLKSDYGATTEEIRRSNIEKREVCAEQLVAAAKKMKAPDGRAVKRVLIGGDFNADPTSPRYGAERTAEILLAGGFRDAWEGTPQEERVTHPGSGRHPDRTIDFVYFRGFRRCTMRVSAPEVPLSDHRMAWFRLE
jgi:endonuclease/exonuclease/phosphatase family metal-dependent hydrolase